MMTNPSYSPAYYKDDDYDGEGANTTLDGGAAINTSYDFNNFSFNNPSAATDFFYSNDNNINKLDYATIQSTTVIEEEQPLLNGYPNVAPASIVVEQKEAQYGADVMEEKKKERFKCTLHNLRNLLAYFLCGLMNNYGYVVMLTAAEDMIQGHSGVVLLANILPTLVINNIAPFFMDKIPFSLRISFFVMCAIVSFQLVAWFDAVWVKLVGVVFASISSGGGEITFLSLSSFYNKVNVSAWSSGTGGAGVFGALSYLALRSWFKLSPKVTLFIITPLPLIMLISYFFIMTKPDNKPQEVKPRVVEDPSFEYVTEKTMQERKDAATAANKLTLAQRFVFLPRLLKYMIPLFLVYYSEYLINQGVVPGLQYANVPEVLSNQYMYYQFIYQTGVFISRSSATIVPIKRVWIPAVLQCVNLSERSF